MIAVSAEDLRLYLDSNIAECERMINNCALSAVIKKDSLQNILVLSERMKTLQDIREKFIGNRLIIDG